MSDKTEVDGRGGAREGAGRKVMGAGKKTQLPVRVDPETHEHLDVLLENCNHSKAQVVEYCIKSTKSVPEELPKEYK